MITFTNRDSIDSFEIFIENFEFRKPQYNFHILLGIFMKEIESDIVDGYEEKERGKVRSLIKQAIYKRFAKIDFNKFYEREKIEKIVLGRKD